MAKTSAERVRAYRERLKLDAAKNAEVKAKDAARNRKTREKQKR